MASPTASAAATVPTTQSEPALKDIHLAANPSFWPPALGWWILLAATLMILSGLFVWLKSSLDKKKLRDKQRKNLLDKLSSLETQLVKNPSNKAIAEINTLLRQYAVNYYSRSKIASLTGADWLKFLDQSGSTKGFTTGAGQILIEAPYQKSVPINFNQDEFIALIRKWVNQLVHKQSPISDSSVSSNIKRGKSND